MTVKWFDYKGFVHHAPIIVTKKDPCGYETSENGPLFSAMLLSLDRGYACPSFWRELRKGKRIFRATPISVFKESHFSFDNMLGFYYRDFRNGKIREGLPVLWWWSEGKPYIRLEAIFFYIVQNPKSIFKKLIYFYLRKAMQKSLRKPFEDTNGKHKWWLRCQMLPESFLTEATEIIGETYHDSWLGVFNYYYRYQKDHPIIKAASEKWEK